MERMMGGEEKEIEMPTTTGLGYSLPKRDSSSPSSSSPRERRSDQQQPPPPPPPHTLRFNDPSQASHHHHHHHLYPPPHLSSNQQLDRQSQRPSTDPDLRTSPVAIAAAAAATSSSPIASGPSNPTRAAGTTSSTPLIRYRECLRNHAASMGSHVVDGCGEFMPSGEEGAPQSLKCAACDCHRNFHRKEVEGSTTTPQQHAPNYHSYKHNNGQFHSTPTSSSLHHHQHHRFPHGVAAPSAGLVPPVMMAFGSSGGAAESSSEDLNMFQSNIGGGQFSVQPISPLSKKRFRTRFTQLQRDRMMEFAEKLGWKIQKHDEEEVQQFCSQVGVKRQVFKVWMHNNKQAMKKQQQQQQM